MIDTIYRCEICGVEEQKPVRWIVIHCSDAQLTIFKWTKEAADAPTRGTTAARHTPRSTSADGLNHSAVESEPYPLRLTGAGPVDSRITNSGAMMISAA
jgi:hypothetical protein